MNKNKKQKQDKKEKDEENKNNDQLVLSPFRFDRQRRTRSR